MTIKVDYIPTKDVAIWTFPTAYNRIFDRTQTLFWHEVPLKPELDVWNDTDYDDYDPFKDYTDGDDYSWAEDD